MREVKRNLSLAVIASAIAGCSTVPPAYPYGAPAIAPTGTDFASRVLGAHNAERAAVRTPPLVWDAALAASAQSHARTLAGSRTLGHSPEHFRVGQGENLWMGTRGAFRPEAMVGDWASEKAMFQPGIFPNVSRTGNWVDVAHYTQIIWRSTQRLGCGVASSASSDFLVCRYAPQGNVNGQPVP